MLWKRNGFIVFDKDLNLEGEVEELEGEDPHENPATDFNDMDLMEKGKYVLSETWEHRFLFDMTGKQINSVSKGELSYAFPVNQT